MSDVPPAKPIVEPSISNEDRLLAVLSHLAYFVIAIIGPLVIMLVKKDSPFVEDQAKEALNFQLAVLIVAIVSGITCIGLPLTIIAAVGGMVYSIIAAVEANKGVRYRYPYTFRMIK